MAETVTQPAPAGNVYSEAQHFALLESALERETASITVEKSELEARVGALESEKAAAATELSEAMAKIDVLEADKVNAEAGAEAVRTELADFKAEIERAARISELKTDRKARVQAANANLDDTFYSEERITRWAEMSDEAFDVLVADLTEMAKASKATVVEPVTTTTTEAARESAAFTGGATPSNEQGPSTLSTLLGAVRRGAIA